MGLRDCLARDRATLIQLKRCDLKRATAVFISTFYKWITHLVFSQETDTKHFLVSYRFSHLVIDSKIDSAILGGR